MTTYIYGVQVPSMSKIARVVMLVIYFGIVIGAFINAGQTEAFYLNNTL
jgi:hypothetical protein